MKMVRSMTCGVVAAMSVFLLQSISHAQTPMIFTGTSEVVKPTGTYTATMNTAGRYTADVPFEGKYSVEGTGAANTPYSVVVYFTMKVDTWSYPMNTPPPSQPTTTFLAEVPINKHYDNPVTTDSMGIWREPTLQILTGTGTKNLQGYNSSERVENMYRATSGISANYSTVANSGTNGFKDFKVRY